MPFVSTSGGQRFASAEGESLLDAALRQDVTMAYSCRTGRCNSCKARLRGGTTQLLHPETGLGESDRQAGWVLTCSRSATSDVELEIDDLGGVHLPPPRTLPCRIQSLRLLAGDILEVVLRLPPSMALDFLPGQYVEIIGHGGVRRSYSIANAPQQDRRLALHIRRVPGGAFSEYWFGQAGVNDLLRLKGPLGTFFLRDTAGVDLLLLATGTGLAPVKAIVEGLASSGARPRSVSVYWGMRRADELYWTPGNRADTLRPGPSPTFVPVLSRAGPGWTGARGYVQHVAIDRHRDWRSTTAYVCGSEAMIEGARQAFVEAGLEERRFHADAFVCSATI
jgi:CDP-4-dehydro-6-deoxyglucose reductase